MVITNIEDFICNNIIRPYLPSWIHHDWNTKEGKQLLQDINKNPYQAIEMCRNNPEAANRAFARLAEIGHYKGLEWYWALDSNNSLIRWITEETLKAGYEIQKRSR